MRGGDRVRERNGDFQKLAESETVFRLELGERLAAHELHRHEMNAVRLFDGVHGDDVRMIERGNGAGFALETRAPIFARGHLGRENFEGDLATELRVLGQINVAHTAGADLLEDLVVGERGSDHIGSSISTTTCDFAPRREVRSRQVHWRVVEPRRARVNPG